MRRPAWPSQWHSHKLPNAERKKQRGGAREREREREREEGGRTEKWAKTRSQPAGSPSHPTQRLKQEKKTNYSVQQICKSKSLSVERRGTEATQSGRPVWPGARMGGPHLSCKPGATHSESGAGRRVITENSLTLLSGPPRGQTSY